MYTKKLFKKSAFTLAEVLVTLGIVGVIAALTLPTLIENYQRQQLVAQLKKSYSLLSQAIERAMAEEKMPKFSGTDIYLYCNSSYTSSCRSTLEKYIRIDNAVYGGSKSYAYLVCTSIGNGNYRDCKKSLNSNVAYAYTGSTAQEFSLADGSKLYVYRSTGTKTYFTVDVNGDDKPNTWGRDVFSFYVEKDSNGTVTPFSPDGPGTPQIISDGWKMEY